MKYKIWDKLNQKFLTKNEVLLTQDGMLYSLVDNKCFSPKPHYTIALASDARDNNGNLVYDMDIIQVDNHVYTILFDNKDGWLALNIVKNCKLSDLKGEIKIIGNRFED